MTLTIDDVDTVTILTISKNDKVLLRKKGTIKSLLRYVFEGTKQENVKQTIIELQQMYVMMVDNKTTITIKEEK